MACGAFFPGDVLVVLRFGGDDGAVRSSDGCEGFFLIPQQLLTCGLFFARGGASLGSATEGHVQNQAGECTDTRAIRTFFARSGEHRLAGVIDALGDQVLRNFLGGFCRTLYTTTGEGCCNNATDWANVRGKDVQQAGGCTELCGKATFFGCGTFGFGSFTSFTCASGNTNTRGRSTASKASRAERKERQGGAQSFTKLTAYSVFVAGCRFKRLLGNTRDFFELGSYGLLCVLGEQCGDTSSCGLGKTNRTGHNAFEKFFGLTTERSFWRFCRTLTRLGYAALEFFASLLALVAFGGEDQTLLRGTFRAFDLINRSVRCGDLVQWHV